MSQQPLTEFTLPGYLRPIPSRSLQPPIVRYGWLIGQDRLMEIARIHFPEVLEYSREPHIYGSGEEEDCIFDGHIPACTSLTLLGLGYPLTICEHFGIEQTQMLPKVQSGVLQIDCGRSG